MSREHWDTVWTEHPPDELSWFQTLPERSVELIAGVAPAPSSVVDVGGGASRLVDELLARDYLDVTVVDLSRVALDVARARLGDGADRITWVHADILAHDFGRTFDVWHDRAVLHFLVDDLAQRTYVSTMARAVPAGGHAVIATFGPDGPTECSGLPVRRYDADAMDDLFGHAFTRVSSAEEVHVTPAGARQQFTYGVYRRV